CGVDTELFRPGGGDVARARIAPGDAPLLLYVGRIAPIKGLETLLDALARLRGHGSSARLVIVGGEADERVDGHEAAIRQRVDGLVNAADLRFGLGREGVQWAARHRWPCVAEAICREYARLEARAEPHLAAARCHE